MAKKKNQRKKTAKPAPSAEPEVKVSSEPTAKKKPFNPVQFLQEVRREGSKVTWTTRNEMVISTIMVLVMVMIMSLFFFVVDQVWRIVIPFILNLGA